MVMRDIIKSYEDIIKGYERERIRGYERENKRL